MVQWFTSHVHASSPESLLLRGTGAGGREAGDLIVPYFRYLDFLPSNPWRSHGDQGEEGCATPESDTALCSGAPGWEAATSPVPGRWARDPG